jgi:hypothetical protein
MIGVASVAILAPPHPIQKGWCCRCGALNAVHRDLAPNEAALEADWMYGAAIYVDAEHPERRIAYESIPGLLAQSRGDGHFHRSSRGVARRRTVR